MIIDWAASGGFPVYIYYPLALFFFFLSGKKNSGIIGNMKWTNIV